MQKLLHNIFLLTTIFICSSTNQSNAVKIQNCTNKKVLIKISYDKSKCSQLIHLGNKINQFNFFCPIFKIESYKSLDLNFMLEDFIEKIIIEFIMQKNQRLLFECHPSDFKGSNMFFLTLQPDFQTTFQFDDYEYKTNAANWTLKISNNLEGKEGSFKTTPPEDIPNSY